MNAQQILTIVQTSVRANLARLQAEKGPKAGADCESMLSGKGYFSLAQDSAGYLANDVRVSEAKLRMIFPESGAMNPKAQKRFIQMVNALHAKTYEKVDLTTARSLLALRAAGGTLNRDALNYICTGKVKSDLGVNTKGVSLSVIDRKLGKVGPGTVDTQVSRSFGEHGFCAALGMTTADGRVNFAVTLDTGNAFVRRFFKMIDEGTQGQIEALGGKGSE